VKSISYQTEISWLVRLLQFCGD